MVRYDSPFKEFLKKILLIDYLTMEIEIQQSDFLVKFREYVDEGDIGIFSDAFEVFSSSKNEYKGHVGYNNFKIRKRKRFFDSNRNIAIATGKLLQQGRMLLIETEINGFNGIMKSFFIIAGAFYIIFMITFLSVSFNTIGGSSFFPFTFIIIHALFMFGIPYFMMRRSVKRMKHDLERELFYITKK